MEKWNKVFGGLIPPDTYQAQIINGEYTGLNVYLKSKNSHIILEFGAIKAIRMLDEGIVQNDLYSGTDFEEFKKDGFKDVIYNVINGEFTKQIKKISDTYWETFNIKHYVIITQNYNIDIITEWEPELKFLQL